MPQQNIIRDSAIPTSVCSNSSGGGVVVESGMALERLKSMLNVPPANRLPDWINPLEKIEQLLTCAICLDRYKNPKLLPCQHSFCMDPCLDNLIDIVRRLVRCPECRAEHPLPYDGVKAFQSNYTLMGFLEIHLQATEENASELESYIKRYNLERCKVCDEKSEVDYCPHCEKRICLECKTTHVDMLKRDLGRLMNQVKRLCTRITDTADTLSRGADSLTINCENVKEEVRDYSKRYVKELKKREDALIAEVETFYNAETRMIKTVRDNLELESSNINEACARVDACLKGEREMNDDELVRYKQMFTDGLDHLRTVNPDADELTNKKIRFIVNDAHLLPHAITQFGELQVCTPQYNHKLAQAEQIYVPRFLQMGLESDNYATKKRCWDPNDSQTWHQQQQQQANSKSQQQTSSLSSSKSNNNDEDAYSSRYRRRQLLEEQAWNRIRGEHPQQRQQRHSPKRTTTTTQEENQNQRIGAQFDNSPWSRVQRMNEIQTQPTPTPQPNSEVLANPISATIEAAPLSATLPPLPPSSSSSSGIARRSQLITPPKPVFKTQSSKKSTEDNSTANGQTSKASPKLAAKSAVSPIAPIAEPASTSTSTSTTTSTNSDKNTNSKSSTTIADKNSISESGEKSEVKSAAEDGDLDQRVANIRKEHEQRQQEQQKTILQIQQRVRAHRLPVDVASAAEASSEEEEEEDEQEPENDDNDNGESIPVLVYPTPVDEKAESERKNSSGETSTASAIDRPLHVNTSEASANVGVEVAQRKISYPFGKSIPQPNNVAIDWKKYLIPSPPDSLAKAAAGRRSSTAASSSAISEIVQRNAVDSSSTSTSISSRFADSRSFNTDESSWNERRRRFVRSKTNPDFSVDANPTTTTNAIVETARANRYLPDNGDIDQRRRRYGFRCDSAASQENSARETVEQRGAAKTRYRRKAERSHSGYVVANGNGGHHDDDHSTNEPQRFEISINGNGNGNETAVSNNSTPGPGARFYRVFTNPKIDYLSKGRCATKFGCKGNGDGQFNWPRGVATVPTTEEIVVCDSSNHRLQIFDKRGRFLKTLGGYGSGRAEFDCLAGVCINKYRQYVITDRYNHRVQIFDSTGRHLREFGAHGQTNGRFNSPWGVAVDQQGFIYVCDKDNHRVQIFQADGNFVGKFGGIGNREGQFQNPHFVACNRQNQLIVTDSSNHRVQIFDHNGHFLFAFGSEGFHEGQFKYPRGVAVDEQGFIVVADSGNNRIQIFYPDGRFYSTFGGWGSNDGQLKGVEGVAITQDGKLVLTDRENHRLQIF